MPDPSVSELDLPAAGVRLHFLSAGAGEPVLFVHGLGGSRLAWLPQVTRLGDEYRSFAIDLPGFGRSGRAPESNLHGLYGASVLAEFCRLAVGEPVHLVGHSMGGCLSLLLALEHPELVRSLTLIASGGLGRELSLGLRLACLPGMEPMLTRIGSRVVSGDPNGAWMRSRLHRMGPEARPALEEALSDYREPDNLRLFLRTLKAGVGVLGQRRQYQLGNRLAELQMPVFVLWGGADPVLPPTHAEVARRHGIPVRMLPGLGHSPHIEEPEVVTEVLVGFWRDAERQRNQPRTLSA